MILRVGYSSAGGSAALSRGPSCSRIQPQTRLALKRLRRLQASQVAFLSCRVTEPPTWWLAPQTEEEKGASPLSHRVTSTESISQCESGGQSNPGWRKQSASGGWRAHTRRVRGSEEGTLGRCLSSRSPPYTRWQTRHFSVPSWQLIPQWSTVGKICSCVSQTWC